MKVIVLRWLTNTIGMTQGKKNMRSGEKLNFLVKKNNFGVSGGLQILLAWLEEITKIILQSTDERCPRNHLGSVSFWRVSGISKRMNFEIYQGLLHDCDIMFRTIVSNNEWMFHQNNVLAQSSKCTQKGFKKKTKKHDFKSWLPIVHCKKIVF